MDLLTITQTIKQWIKSSETSDHLLLCDDAIDTFVTDRFKGKLPASEVEQAQEELQKLIEERFTIIMQK